MVNIAKVNAMVIYALIDPRVNKIRYVGKTTNTIRVRLSGHICDAKTRRKNTRCAAWIRSLLNVGVTPEIKILEDVSDEQSLNERECYWISYGHFVGWDLVNHTGGGEGTSGYRFTNEMRHHFAETRKGTDNRNARLTETDVISIRELKHDGTLTHIEIARKFQISESSVEMIVHGKTWKHVGGYIGVPSKNVGEDSSRAKLSNSQVIQIRRRYADGDESGQLATEYGMSVCHVLKIISGKTRSSAGGIINPSVSPVGEGNPNAKLTRADVDNIRSTYLLGNKSYSELAKIFNVSKHTIRNIVLWRNWK